MQGGQSATPGSEKFAKNLEKRGKNQEKRKKEEKSGRKGKNREGSFTLPLLTDRASYAAEFCVKFEHDLSIDVYILILVSKPYTVVAN